MVAAAVFSLGFVIGVCFGIALIALLRAAKSTPPDPAMQDLDEFFTRGPRRR